MTKEESIAKALTSWWKTATAKEIVDFQLYEKKLCMDFPAFHAAVEECLGRPVWTHEFADAKSLKAEYEGRQKAPASPLESLERAAPRKTGKVFIVLGGG